MLLLLLKVIHEMILTIFQKISIDRKNLIKQQSTKKDQITYDLAFQTSPIEKIPESPPTPHQYYPS